MVEEKDGVYLHSAFFICEFYVSGQYQDCDKGFSLLKYSDQKRLYITNPERSHSRQSIAQSSRTTLLQNNTFT